MNCANCQSWSQPGNVWKTFYWFPLHCHICESVMAEGEPYILRQCIICETCNEKMELKKRLHYTKNRFCVYGNKLERYFPWDPEELRI